MAQDNSERYAAQWHRDMQQLDSEPDRVVVTEMTRGQLALPSEIVDHDGKPLSEFDLLRAMEVGNYDSQGVFISTDPRFLSEKGQDANRKLRYEDPHHTPDLDRQTVAVVSNRPTTEQKRHLLEGRRLKQLQESRANDVLPTRPIKEVAMRQTRRRTEHPMRMSSHRSPTAHHRKPSTQSIDKDT